MRANYQLKYDYKSRFYKRGGRFESKMSTVTIDNSPFHNQCRVTRIYGYRTSSYYCGYHTGIDLVPTSPRGH